MHPAYSVILFTTSSGAGYGLLFWLSLGRAFGLIPHTGWSFFLSIALALMLITAGLLASTFHLGHPERAWRAFSQWRTSWLSREGVLSVLTYGPSGLLALMSLFGIEGAAAAWLAALSAVGAVATVWCTGMIYASLRTIRQWNLTLVPVVYLALSAASGAVLLGLMRTAFGAEGRLEAGLAAATLLAALALKVIYFRRIDGDPGAYTASMALGGLGRDGIRQIDPPHTRPNYVMREMGYAIARKHAARLRRAALACLFAVPVVLALLVVLTGALAPLAFLAATLSAAAGLVLERWLFFAEAEHVSMLYYGKARA